MARILLITHISPPAIDGGSQVIHKVGEYLKRTGHEVALLSSDASSTDDFTHSYSKVLAHQRTSELEFHLPVYTIFHRPLKLVSKLLPLFSVFAKGPVFKLIPFIKFLRFYLKFRPEYIIAGPLPTTIILYAHFLRFLSRVLAHQRTKLVINASFHQTDRDFHNPLLINALKSSDFIWTLTDYETNYFHQNFGISISKMINVGNGIDNSLLLKKPISKNTTTLNLIYIGSFSAHKGIDTIIDSLSYLPKDSTLTLAGQSTLYFSSIKEKIHSPPVGIKKNIKIIFNFKTSELSNLLDQSSILISASSQESFGIILLEAMARGVPVIGSDIPATSELIKKSKAGLIFKSGDPSDLAKKIMSLNNQADLRAYGNKGLSFATLHTWDRIGESLWQKISS